MTRTWVIGVGLAAIMTIAAGPSPRAANDSPDDEQQIGQQVFDELKSKGEIIASSPLYDALTPIATALIRTAQPRYIHPFKFYLVHEAQPNAFSVPGGNVYVTDSLLYFVRNSEQLAGTLGHEVSHTIHHDSMKLIEKERQIARRELGAAILLGPSAAHVLAITLGTTVDFPNHDPIFHNAFSNYNGQIFDVSLYPPGSSRSITFQREGVVRVFCNIHPAMSAVIVVLKSPYFCVSGKNGSLQIAGVPPGSYRMHVFHERATDHTLSALTRIVEVTGDGNAFCVVLPEARLLPVDPGEGLDEAIRCESMRGADPTACVGNSAEVDRQEPADRGHAEQNPAAVQRNPAPRRARRW